MKILMVLGGTPPSGKLLNEQIQSADFVIACDGGGNCFRGTDYVIDVLIGDMDSFHDQNIIIKTHLPLDEQASTDFQKGLAFVDENLIPDQITILGSGGGRTDHLVNNLQICALFDPSTPMLMIHELPESDDLNVEIILRKTPESYPDYPVREGALFSALAVSPFSSLSLSGLKWDIKVTDQRAGLISQSNLCVVDNPIVTLD